MPRETAIAFVLALTFFATDVTELAARVTDLSALRMLHGDVPYRDFWTMYAPGSFTALSLAFRVFGPHLIVSNLLGILAASAAIATFYDLVRRQTSRTVAVGFATVVAVAYYGTGYSTGFTSYPPAILLTLLAVRIASRGVSSADTGWAVRAGTLVGLAVLFKHDVAGYSAIAITASLVWNRRAARLPIVSVLWRFVTACAIPPVVAIITLISLGAGAAAWTDLVRFPLGDFRYVRGEYFPLLPTLRDGVVSNVEEFVHWGICNLPSIALFVGLRGLVRTSEDRSLEARFLVVVASMAYVLHWIAAHSQINTNAISLPLWSLVVVAAAWRRTALPNTRAGIAMLLLTLAGWASLYPARAVYLAVTTWEPSEWVGLPRLEGIRGPASRVAELRTLSAAMALADRPEAPLLFLSRRNDAVVYAESFPFWLSERRSATAFHELHPGITDTAVGQRRMLAEIGRGPLPVVVREYRFNDAALDGFRAGVMPFVAIGSTLIDDWVARNYEPDRGIGAYQILRRRSPPQ